jgi:ketosteroid isomerase-like protein
MRAGDLHPRVQAALNDGDVDGLVELYEPDTRMVRDDGSVGLDAIRQIWAGLVAVGGQIRMTTRYVVETGDTALLSNSWTFEVEGTSFSGVTAEVARRQADGSWLYLIDNPYAGNEDA